MDIGSFFKPGRAQEQPNDGGLSTAVGTGFCVALFSMLLFVQAGSLVTDGKELSTNAYVLRPRRKHQGGGEELRERTVDISF